VGSKNGELCGSVLWFNDVKGFGFIKGQDNVDYFVHYTEIESEERRKTLIADQQVKFTPNKAVKGMAATGVRVVQNIEG